MRNKYLLVRLSLLVCMFSVTRNAVAQDVHLSQFYMAPLMQNPALAGANHDLQAVINYKQQWKSITNPYTTMAASLDLRLGKKKVKNGFWAIGINFFNDKAGSSQVGLTQGNLTAAYQVKLNEYHKLGVGFQGGFSQWTSNYTNLQWGNQYDGSAYNASLSSGEAAAGSSFIYGDIGAGINWTYNNRTGTKMVTDNHDQRFNLGVAFFHVNRPGYSSMGGPDKLYMKYVINGQALFSVPNSKLAFAPGFFYAAQGPARELYAGTLIRYSLKQESKYTKFEKGAAVSLGAFLRAKDAVVASFLIEFAQYAVGLSYDINTSGLKSATAGRGGFELAIRFVNPNPFLYTARKRF